MNLLACVPAIFILVVVFDRLRQVNWKTARSLTVTALLAQAGVGLWGLYDAFTGSVAWWQWLLLIGAVLWLAFTRGEWRTGVPLHVQTGAGELGSPELKS